MDMNLDKNFWANRYQTGQTGWDAGTVTTPIKALVDHLVETQTDKNLKILIPGAGTGHEAAYLWTQGFHNVYVCDWAEEALNIFKKNVPQFPQNHLLITDFFQLHGQYDLIIEQTFFCALNPSLRPQYAQKMAGLLNTEGVLAGVLFGKNFTSEGPPFGGDKAEYVHYFEPYFQIMKMEDCYNSIPPREQNELWIKMVKKNALTQ